MTTCFSLCQRYLIGGDYNGRLKIWDVETGELLVNRLIHDGMISAVCAIGRGRIVTAGKDRTTQVWDITSVTQSAPTTQMLTQNKHHSTTGTL